MSLFAMSSTNDLSLGALFSSGASHSSGEAATLREGAVNVDADATIVVHIVLFLILLAALKPLLFDPLLKLFEERELRTMGAIKKAREEDAKTSKADGDYGAQMAKVQAEGHLERERIRGEGLKKEADILAAVRRDAQNTLAEGRARVGAEGEAARKALEIESANLGRDLASRVLGREVRG